MKIDEAQLNNLHDVIPDVCPICEYLGIQTIVGVSDVVKGSLKYTENYRALQDMVICDTICEHCKMPSAYAVVMNTFGTAINAKLIIPLPQIDSSLAIPKAVEELSNKFVRAYHDAYSSEQMGLSDISGMGYRKALECLVTDYCMKKLNVSKENAENWRLAKLIDQIPDDRIKKVAQASSWIGNDETHYFRQNPDYDIEDLKAWLGVFINYVEMSSRIDEAQELVGHRQSKKFNGEKTPSNH